MRLLFLLLIMVVAGCFPLIDMDGKYYPDTGSSEEFPCEDGEPTSVIDPGADNDLDGVTGLGGDCNDCDPMISPLVAEICDGVDNDCDGTADNGALDALTWYEDQDGDGVGVEENTQTACEQPDGYVDVSGDCDDTDFYVHPWADEYCDEVDQDCDGATNEDAVDASDWYQDADEDGFGNEFIWTSSCTQPSGYVANKTDCDDTNVGVNPNSNEVCDEIDNDCDEMVDDADIDVDPTTFSTWYLDADSDGYGDPAVLATACSAPSNYVANQTDCDDANSNINPGAAEVCGDKIDNDCVPGNDTTGSIWYADTDGDGYGDIGDAKESCTTPAGYVLDNTDCDDTDASIYPGASEYCDSADNDCDGTTDESDAVDASTWYRDSDSDGYGDVSTSLVSCSVPSGYVSDTTDCDDTDALVNPGASEVCVTSYDDDCDGSVNESSAVDASTWYFDSDSDGWGDAATSTVGCTAPAGYVDNDFDCDDTDAKVGGSAEVCDGLDNDCDGTTDEDVTSTYYRDADSDGYGVSTTTIQDCSVPSGYASSTGDCDDTRSNVYPGASEYCSTAYDDDCDGSVNESGAVDASTWYLDFDSDTFGDASSSTGSCTAPAGYVADDTDCDDTRSGVNPGASEYCFTSYDDDCDGSINESGAVGEVTYYLDADSDGYGVSTTTIQDCSVPSGYASSSGDCDDTDPGVNPGASEYCSTSYDDDCDGTVNESSAVDASTWYLDFDSDTFGDASSSTISCSAPTGYVADDTDCDDSDADVSPDGYEVYYDVSTPGSGINNCADGLDNDCTGGADSADTQCSDEDGDSIPDGVDYIFPCDTDSDGLNEAACLRSEMFWDSPWSEKDCIQQIGAFNYLSVAGTNALETITWGGETIGVCPIFPSATGTAIDARSVSSLGIDGSSVVDTSDCSDWMPAEIDTYCTDWYDNLCTSYSPSDGCEATDLISFAFDGIEVTP